MRKDSLERKSAKPKACSPQCQNGILVGDKFSRLTVIEIISKKREETEYKCKCDCGNIISTKSNLLKGGKIKSCGCYRQDRMSEIGKQNTDHCDLKGQVFGKLTVLRPTEKRQGRGVIWECKCECGNIYYASTSNLKNNSVTRCNECHISSKGEEKIKNLLEQHNISFETEKKFDNCRFIETNKLARFDFYVDNKYIIEYDGEQHYKVGASPYNNPDKFKITQEHDKYKNEWCKKHNIPIIRIPYWEYNNLKIEDLILKTSKYLIL